MRPNILLLTHRIPFPPNRGDRIRAYHLLKHLCRVGNVWLGSLADEPFNRESETHLRELCEDIAVAELGKYRRWVSGAWSLATGGSATEGLFRSGHLRRKLQSWAQQTKFDAIVIFCSSMAQFLDDVESRDSVSVVDLVDVDSQKWFDYSAAASGAKSWLYRLEGRRVRALEESLARRVDYLTVVSEPEAELFRSFCAAGTITAVNNGVDTEYFHPDSVPETAEPAHCVFVGVLDYRANVDGLCWFCENVWQQVKKSVPHATFSIVGRRPTQTVERLGRFAGVNVVGEVADVRSYLARASASIAPLRIARGVQNKVLEAMAAGVPVIATNAALTGLELQPGRDALVADDATQWHENLTRLLTDEALQAELSAAGRAYVVNHHCWERKLSKFDELLGLADAEVVLPVMMRVP